MNKSTPNQLHLKQDIVSERAAAMYGQPAGREDLLKLSSEELAAGYKQLVSERALRSLFFFTREVLGYQGMVEGIHSELCELVAGKDSTVDLRVGGRGLALSQTSQKNRGASFARQKKKLILLPRGCFKSSVVTIGYSLWRLVQDPNLRILIDSETQQNSKNFLHEMKEHMTRNETLREFFPTMDSKDDSLWTKTEVIVSTRKMPRKEPSVTATGVDITKTGMHYDLIIADDIVSQNNITTIEQRDKVIAHYKLLLALLEPGGELIVIGTRWHDDDVYGYILQNEPGFERIIKKAVQDDGSLLFPERLTKEFLDDQRRAMGSYLFSCQYQNEPVDTDAQVFKKSWIQYYAPETLQLDKLTKFIAIDPAISDKRDADYSALVVVGQDRNNNIYVLDYTRARYSPNDLINEIFRLQDKWHPNKVGIEAFAFQKALQYQIRDEMRKRNRFFVLETFTTDSRTGKDARIRALQPRFENKTVHLKHGMTELEDELMRFPMSSHDDLIDALAYTLQMFTCPYDYEEERKELDEREFVLAPAGKCGY